MGYAGKAAERARAPELRAGAWTLQEIAAELGVAKASVSVWVRDVEFTPRPRNRGNSVTRPHPHHLRRLAEVEEADRAGRARLGALDEQAFLAAGTAFYVGEGSKRDGMIALPNADERVIRFFVRWLRHHFDIDEARMRCKLYLHEGLDLDVAEGHWSSVADVPVSQFTKAYRAEIRTTQPRTKHPFGVCTVAYHCSATHRAIAGLSRALLS